MNDMKSLRDLDVRHLWHPYTDIGAYEEGPFTCFDSGQGVNLYAPGGPPILDGISSWWATALGHSHPKLVAAIQEQAGILQHSILGNLTHPRAVELAARLADLAPGELNHVYFACDGASATEAALKMAIQYWYNQGIEGRDQFVSLEEGYHGDTLGAVGVGFVPQFHRPFAGAIRKSHVAASPFSPSNTGSDEEREQAEIAYQHMERLIEEHHKSLAAVILEPLCQGAAGIRIYPEEYLRKVRALCDEYEVLLIADEIAVGFGRTGHTFACERAGITPDILCVGKALTGGYLPMSATIATEKIYNAFRSDAEHDRTFYDGHTYCGNPITSACALAALDVYASENIVAQASPRIDQLREGFALIGQHESVAYHKTLGHIAMCAFKDVVGGAEFAKRVKARALELGLFIRPLGEVLYLWPPLISTQAELGKMLELFEQAIEECEKD